MLGVFPGLLTIEHINVGETCCIGATDRARPRRMEGKLEDVCIVSHFSSL